MTASTGRTTRPAGGLGAIYKNEVLKTRKRVAFWVTMVLFAALGASGPLLMVRLAGFAREMTGAEAAFSLPDSWRMVWQPSSGLGPYFLALLLVLLIAPEFRWRTARQNVIDGLSKERFFLGKLMLSGTLWLVFLAIPVLIGLAGAAFSSAPDGPGLFRGTDVSFFGGYALSLLIFGSIGILLATLLRASGPALLAFFAFTLVEPIMASWLRRYEALSGAMDLLPMRLAETLVSLRFHYSDGLVGMLVDRPERQGLPPPVEMDYPDYGVAAAFAAAYCAAFIVAAFVSTKKRDL